MKIILINNLYAPWIRGGAERIVEKTAEGLEKRGHQVLIITTAPKESQTPKVRYLRSAYYNLKKLPFALRLFWHLNDLFDFSKRAKIKKILQEFKPDLVVTHNLQGIGYLLPGLLRKMKIKHIHTLHDIQLLHPSGLMIWGQEEMIDSIQAKIYQLLMKILLGSPAVVVSPSKWLLHEHYTRGFFKKSENRFLPNYFLEPKKGEGAAKGDVFTFLFVGQLEAHKGIEFLVETFFKFSHSAELLVVGGGSQDEQIKKRARGNGKIKFLGRKNPPEVAALMLSANCLIVPSLCYENSPTVIYEAIAAGLPVIGSKLGGITELLESAGGLLFEPGDQKDLLDKMERMFTHPEESDRIKTKEMAFKMPDYLNGLLQ